MNVRGKKQFFTIVFAFLTLTLLTGAFVYWNRNDVPQYLKMDNINIMRNSLFETAFRRQVDDSLCKNIKEITESPKILKLPNDTVLDSMDENQLMELHWRYINTIQVLCRNQTRYGSMQDGGKEICIDEMYKPKQPCLVYSFGSNFQFDFEVAMIKHFQCEIHTFDPSKPIQGNVPNGINFHLTGLSDHSFTNDQRWEMASLTDIRTKLNHINRTIDILKIDVEGAEWIALPQIFKSGDLNDVKQLSIEIHYGRMSVKEKFAPWGGVVPKEQLKLLRSIYDAGFHIFMHEHNLFAMTSFSDKYPTITTVNEISLINVNWREKEHVH